MLHISLDQWQALVAVVEHGGYAQAAEAINKGQSSVSYAVSKLEDGLNVRVFNIKGRKAVLTPTGEALYRRAKVLLEQANQAEALAKQFASGWEAELTIAMDALFPNDVMLATLNEFSKQQPLTRIELLETVLSGTDEALIKKEADIAIGSRLPQGFYGEPLITIDFVAVASPDHPLHQIDHALSHEDLRLHRQLVVRDSGSQDMDAGWLGAEQRLTVPSITTAIEAACLGLGYAWYPEVRILELLKKGSLKPLNLAFSGKQPVMLNLIYSDGDYPGKAAELFGHLLKKQLEVRELLVNR